MSKIQDLHKVSLPAQLFLAVFAIVLFEGAIRKWLLGSATIPLMALRDLMVFSGVLWGIYKKRFRFDRLQESILLAWTTLVVVWTLLQVILEIQPAVVAVIGLRGWLLYLWFALLCFRCLSYQDLGRILVIILYTLPPMSALVVFQHFMPPGHPINVQPDTPVGEVFTVAMGVVRTTGTFSFTAGYAQYLAFVTPLVLAVVAQPSLCGLWLRYSAFFSYFLGVAVSGSRGAIAFSVLMIIMFGYGLLRKGGKGLAQLIVIALLVLPLAAAVPVFLRSAIDATSTRFEQASEAEDVTARVIHMVIGSPSAWSNFSFLGHGVGLGSNAALKFIPDVQKVFLLGENEMERVIGEGGFLGLLFVFAKIIVVFFGIWFSHRRIKQDLVPWLFWCFLFPQLLFSSTVGQITINAFTFLGLGVGWVLIKMNRYPEAARG